MSFDAYHSAFLALGLYGALHLTQLLVADIVGIRAGHTPGSSVQGGHDDLHFRVARAHANTNESIGAAILIAGFAIAVRADPVWVTRLLWLFLACRIGHMAAYYADQRLLRSVSFGLSLLCLLALFASGARVVFA